MTTVNVDLKLFTESLNRSLGWVWLQPEVVTGDEPTPPAYASAPPVVMTSFALVPSSKYRFEYSVRYARFTYLLERDGAYEAGELTAIHDLPAEESTAGNEPSPPSDVGPFVPPTITTGQTVSIGSVGSLGVTFSFIHDDNTDGSNAKFGLGFKVTDASPAVHPRLILAYMTAFSMEDI